MDFIKSNGSRTIMMRLLHFTGCRSIFPSSFGGELLPWCFATGGFASSLLQMSH